MQYRKYWREFDQALNGTAIVFSFVRHPEQRLVSAFRNFFVDKRNGSRERHLPALESRGFRDSNSLSKNFGIFLDYVEESFEADLLYTDRHWRPQSINIAANDIQYDLIGKLENLRSDIQNIFSMIGRGGFLEEVHIDVNYNASTGARYVLSLEERNRVERLYKVDYEIFGY